MNEQPRIPEKGFEESEDLEKAQAYWETRLTHEVRIEKPQDPQCEFAIVVPVYNEKPDRILNQLDSLRNQKDFDQSRFEVIYVVNNDLPKDDPKSKEVIEQNRKVIELLRGVQDMNVFVIDKSTPGNEIEECNVGKARNRGVAEASLRFHENGKNGIIIQTDADTYFEDPEYFVKAKKLFEEDPSVIGIAGGLIFEFNPDTDNAEDREILRKKIEKILLTKKWKLLAKFIARSKRHPDEQILSKQDQFSGANMISRSFESAAIGGLKDLKSGEDPRFSKDLAAYGKERNKKIIGARKDLLVVTALRDSDRTPASFKKDFDEADLAEPVMSHDPLGDPGAPDVEITEEGYQRLVDHVRTLPRGKELLDYIDFVVGNMRVAG